MIKSTLFNIILAILVSLQVVSAQKVKYKDIYGLLSTNQFDQAEPFLKAYLKDNTDNPNAYLYMGRIYQEKSMKADILLQTDKAIQQMDSSILFYDKSLKTITEKELRKNEDYYTAYNRRDLRTGEFGVKLSDVQLDIENKITAMRERIDKVKMVKYYFSNAEDLYKRSTTLYQSIQTSFPGELELYLRANDATISKLETLSVRFDSCSKMFENYKASLSNLGKTKYNQTWNVQEIVNFKRDGVQEADFYGTEVMVWDYKGFATKTLDVIEKEVAPAMDKMVKFDIEINKLKTKVETDSASVRNDIASLNYRLTENPLKKYDADPMPYNIFALKVAELGYKSSVIDFKTVAGNDEIAEQLNAVREQHKFISKVDSLASRLAGRDLENDIKNYNHYVSNTFSSGDILKMYVRGMKEYAGKEKAKTAMELSRLEESLRWLINDSDSIPLFTTPVKTRFRPLSITDKYTAGLTFKDSVSAEGYFFTVTPSRKPDVKVNFQVDKTNFREMRLNYLKGAIVTDPNGQIFFPVIFTTKPDSKGKYAVTVAKIYRSDGLSWNSNILLDFIPIDIAFMPDTGEVVFKSEAGPTLSVDKNGSIKL